MYSVLHGGVVQGRSVVLFGYLSLSNLFNVSQI